MSKTDPNFQAQEVLSSNATHSSYKDHENVLLRDEQDANRKPRWVRIRHKFREPLGEFFGVFTLIIFGDGVVAQVVLSKGQRGDYQSINWG
jgi:aquaglyceroporin related protein, other eukaryote